MQITTITRPDQLAPLAAPWNELAAGRVFLRHEWIDAWWRHYGERAAARRALFVLAVHEEGRLVGAAPWYLEPGRADGRVARFLGSGEVCSDHLTVLAEPGREAEVAHAIAARLISELRDGWDALELDAIDAGDPGVDRLVAALAERGALVHRRPGPNCWRIALPDDWEQYLAQLSKSHRKQLRRLESRVLETPRARLHVARSPDELERGWSILVDLHQRRRERLGQAGCFASQHFADFHAELARRLLPDGSLRLAWLELDGKPVAVEYHFAGGGEIYAYQSGIDPDAADDEPGRLITVALVRRAIEEGFRGFDLLRGDEPYKPHWRAEPTRTQHVRIASPTRSGRLRHRAWLARHAVKRTITQLVARRSRADRKASGGDGTRVEGEPCELSAPALNGGSSPVAPRPEMHDATNPISHEAVRAASHDVARFGLRRRAASRLPAVKSLLLHAYYHGTLARRAVRNRRLSRRNGAPVMVLMYHRVADDVATGWTVSNRTFARQIDWLTRRFSFVSLEEAQRRIRQGNPQACIAITFDDGYAENCEHALPLLIERGIPFAYFVATDFVRAGCEFPHDAALGVRARPNTVQQIAQLAKTPRVELGGHTRGHVDCGRINDREELWSQIVGGARDLEELTGRPVRHFAFPYGQPANLSRAAVQIAREAGFASISTAYGGYNLPGNDAFQLQRIPVDDDLIRLKNWTTFDPRKIGITARYARAVQPLLMPQPGELIASP